MGWVHRTTVGDWHTSCGAKALIGDWHTNCGAKALIGLLTRRLLSPRVQSSIHIIYYFTVKSAFGHGEHCALGEIAQGLGEMACHNTCMNEKVTMGVTNICDGVSCVDAGTACFPSPNTGCTPYAQT